MSLSPQNGANLEMTGRQICVVSLSALRRVSLLLDPCGLLRCAVRVMTNLVGGLSSGELASLQFTVWCWICFYSAKVSKHLAQINHQCITIEWMMGLPQEKGRAVCA